MRTTLAFLCACWLPLWCVNSQSVDRQAKLDSLHNVFTITKGYSQRGKLAADLSSVAFEMANYTLADNYADSCWRYATLADSDSLRGITYQLRLTNQGATERRNLTMLADSAAYYF